MGQYTLNKAQCNNCGDILISHHRHDGKGCKCWIQSAQEDQKFPERFKWELDELNYMHTPEYEDFRSKLHGIYVDGGLEYIRRGYYQLEDLKELSEVNDDIIT